MIRIKSNDQNKVRSLKAGWMVTSATLGSVSSTEWMVVQETKTAVHDSEWDAYTKAGDVWHKVSAAVIGKSGLHTGWVAQRHKGEDLCIVDEVEKIPPTAELPSVAVMVDLYPVGKRVIITSEFDMTDFTISVNGREFTQADAG